MLISLAPVGGVRKYIIPTTAEGLDRCMDWMHTLGYHLDVDIRLCQSAKHAACDTDHMLHLLPDQAENGQIPDDINGPVALQLVDGLLQCMVFNLRLQCH